MLFTTPSLVIFLKLASPTQKPKIPFPFFSLRWYINPSSRHLFVLLSVWLQVYEYAHVKQFLAFSLINLSFADLIYRPPTPA